MYLLNPKKPDYKYLDKKSENIMLKTIEFFENKGLAKLKYDDHERVWYQDFLDFQASIGAFATLMTPSGYGDDDSRWDSARICDFNEILGFYGLSYWYTWQVSMLGLGPIWLGDNEDIKHKTAQYLKDGEIFAFGLSEKEHGADLISSEMTLKPNDDGTYTANGDKYYIGNANKAKITSTFGKIAQTSEYVFFAADSSHKNYDLIKNVTNTQNYVAAYGLRDYPITENEILSRGRKAWDDSLATIAFCKYNLGWASIGICTHAFYEAINHASKRKLFNRYVTDFSQIKTLFVDAYSRLIAMKLFAYRASDYMRAASEDDRRYLLYNPLVKMKVTTQGEEVINHIWDVIAAKGFEKDMYFETAARDIRGLPKLEGTVHVNMVLVIKFMNSFLFKSADYKPLAQNKSTDNDEFLFKQGSTSKAQNKIVFHDYNIAYKSKDMPNLKIFLEQVEGLKTFLTECPPDKEQNKDLDYMLTLGEMFTLVPYGQLIIENAALEADRISGDLLDQIFDVMIRDFSKHALNLYLKPSATKEQMKLAQAMIKKPQTNIERFNKVYDEVLSHKDIYEMNA